MNVLILSLAYAPYSGVGAARMTSLSKYLIDKGCGVTVVCYDSSVFGDKEQNRIIPEEVKIVPVEKENSKRENIKNLERIVEGVVKRGQFALCISSVGPFETMFFVKKLWKKWKVPYIIDYRDPWFFENNSIKLKGMVKYKQLLYKCICFPIERCAIKNATKIVLVTDKSREDIMKRYSIDKNKCKVIFNGYEDAVSECSLRKSDVFVITIAGKFASYDIDVAERFLDVCKEVSAFYPLKVVHVGEKDAVSEKRYPEVYFNVGIKSHKDTMEILAESDAFLVSCVHQNALGTKVFDYIALNKPIIYIGIVPSELSEFLGRFEHSYICEDRQQIFDVLKSLAQKCPVFLTKDDVKKYSRQQQNEVYWSLINEIIN